MSQPAIFLDRDGYMVRVRMSGTAPEPPRSLAEMEVLADAEPALRRFREAGFATVVITNQPDVARGLVHERVVRQIHRSLRSRLPLDAIYYCPHDTRDGCECRKPKPGLILRAASSLDLDLPRSYMIGDRWVDLQAAVAAGVYPVLLETDYSWDPTSEGAPSTSLDPGFSGRTLTQCADFILSSGG
jgi:D-glycero-D-manno-heptose 1,7-bisphosphate phosphatase